MIFEGNRYSRKGFLYKNFTLSAVIIDGVKPTLAELERFEEQPEGIDLELPAEKEDKAVLHSFSAGDNVEVCEGELINLQVKIIDFLNIYRLLLKCHFLGKNYKYRRFYDNSHT